MPNNTAHIISMAPDRCGAVSYVFGLFRRWLRQEGAQR